jgi:hypothetical protein
MTEGVFCRLKGYGDVVCAILLRLEFGEADNNGWHYPGRLPSLRYQQ